jgi:hypothetical protein
MDSFGQVQLYHEENGDLIEQMMEDPGEAITALKLILKNIDEMIELLSTVGIEESE